MTSPLLTLNDGHQMPQLGFGLWQVPAPTTSDTVATALRLGYRLVDGAAPEELHSKLHAAVQQT